VPRAHAADSDVQCSIVYTRRNQAVRWALVLEESVVDSSDLRKIFAGFLVSIARTKCAAASAGVQAAVM